MKKIFLNFMFTTLLLAAFLSCNSVEPPPDDSAANTITLTAEWTDLYRINVKWNRAKADTLEPFTYRLTQTDEQGNKTTKEFIITGADTNYTAGEVDSLPMGTRYWFNVEGYNSEGKLKDTSRTLSAKTLSPTSHDIVWQIDTLGNGFLYDVWGVDENNVWAVGAANVQGGSSGIIKWDGNNWNVFPSFAGIKQGIFGFDENNIFVVGDYTNRGVVGIWNGSNWTEYRDDYFISRGDTVYPLRSVWGSSPTDVWAVGDNGTIIHWDGSEWRKEQGIVGTNNSFWDLWGVDANSIYTVTGSLTNHSQLWYYDGTLWKNISENIPGVLKNFYTVWVDKSNSGFIAGNTVLRMNRNILTEETGINALKVLTVVRGNGFNDVIFGGQRGTVFHFNGVEFKEYPKLRAYEGPLNEILGAQVFGNKIFLVGYTDKALVYIGTK